MRKHYQITAILPGTPNSNRARSLVGEICTIREILDSREMVIKGNGYTAARVQMVTGPERYGDFILTAVELVEKDIDTLTQSGILCKCSDRHPPHQPGIFGCTKGEQNGRS